MRKITSAENIFISLVQEVRRNGIFPFTETPSDERSSDTQDENALNASDLFSLFTADIIKEEMVFVR